MKIFIAVMTVLLLVFSTAAYAGKPTNITFVKKENTLLGKTYYVYKVGCSNGRRVVISGWDEKQRWCQGKSESNCQTSRLEAAAEACK